MTRMPALGNTLGAGRFHIVILEDNIAHRYVMRHSVENAISGCKVTAFTGGVAAMAYVSDPASLIPDLVILDFNVPGVEGASVLNEIRNNARWSQAGDFMFTADQNPTDMASVKKLGVDEYLIQPVDLAGFEEFRRVIGGWLKQRPTGHNWDAQ